MKKRLLYGGRFFCFTAKINADFHNSNPENIYMILGARPMLTKWSDLLKDDYQGEIAVFMKYLELFNGLILGLYTTYLKEYINAMKEFLSQEDGLSLKSITIVAGEDKIVLMATYNPLLCLMADKRIVIAKGGIKDILITSSEEKHKTYAKSYVYFGKESIFI